MGACLALFSPIAEVPGVLNKQARSLDNYRYDSFVASLRESVNEGRKLVLLSKQLGKPLPKSTAQRILENAKSLEKFDRQWESRQRIEYNKKTNQMMELYSTMQNDLTRKEDISLRRIAQADNKLAIAESRKSKVIDQHEDTKQAAVRDFHESESEPPNYDEMDIEEMMEKIMSIYTLDSPSPGDEGNVRARPVMASLREEEREKSEPRNLKKTPLVIAE